MTLPHEIPATGPSVVLAQAMQALVPVLTTDRLTLRSPRIEDFAAYARIAEQPSARFIFGEVPSRGHAWVDFGQLIATWILRGHGIWTVEAEGCVQGFVLIGFEPGDDEPELGFMFLPEAEGKSIAFEAATAARDYAFSTLGLRTLVSYIDHENTRSIALATRLGGTRDRAAEKHDDTVTYRYIKEEARS
ncbi:MAG: GNAT family N-acetyltransferase [Pseudomonadota bacterium]